MQEIVIGCLLAFIFFQDFLNRKERQKLTEAFIAKNLKEIQDLESIRKVKPTKQKEEEPLSTVGDLDDKAFDKYIKSVNDLKAEDFD
jgi:hypothetical protein